MFHSTVGKYAKRGIMTYEHSLTEFKDFTEYQMSETSVALLNFSESFEYETQAMKPLTVFSKNQGAHIHEGIACQTQMWKCKFTKCENAAIK